MAWARIAGDGSAVGSDGSTWNMGGRLTCGAADPPCCAAAMLRCGMAAGWHASCMAPPAMLHCTIKTRETSYFCDAKVIDNRGPRRYAHPTVGLTPTDVL